MYIRKEGMDPVEIDAMVHNILMRLDLLEEKHAKEKAAIVGKGRNMVSKALEEEVESVLIKKGISGRSQRKTFMEKAVEKAQTAMNRDDFQNEMDDMYR